MDQKPRRPGLLERVSSALELPADLLAGLPRVELIGDRELRMENHRGISYYSDTEIRIPEGQVIAIVVQGPCRFWGLFGRGEEYYIPWECIQRIGDDIILIDKPFQRREPDSERKRRRSF